MKVIAGQARALLAYTSRRRVPAPEPTVGAQAFLIVACLGLAIGVRWAIDFVVPGAIPYATFFPAIAVAGFLGGFRCGLITWILSIPLGLFLFLGGVAGLNEAQATSVVLFAGAGGVELLVACWLRDLMWDARRNENLYRALVQSSSNLITEVDASGAWLERQVAWETLTGMSWPSYGAQGYMERVHEEDRNKLAVRDTPATVEVRVRDAQGLWRWFSVRSAPVFDIDGNLAEQVASWTDVTDSKQTEEHRELLLRDMRHRFKNFLAVIQALVAASKPNDDPNVAAFANTFLKRVRTLQSAGDLVMKANAEDVDLAEVLPAALAPFLSDKDPRIAIEGPALPLKEHTVGAVALAAHELATNAAKYGALSVPTGRVKVSWRQEAEAEALRTTIDWIETGGPAVQTPSRRGFGTRIISTAMSREPNGEVHLNFLPEGLHCRMTFAAPAATRAANDANATSEPMAAQ